MDRCYIDYIFISLPIERHYVGPKNAVFWDVFTAVTAEDMPLQEPQSHPSWGISSLRTRKTQNLILKMGTICSSETSVLARPTRRNIQKGIRQFKILAGVLVVSLTEIFKVTDTRSELHLSSQKQFKFLPKFQVWTSFCCLRKYYYDCRCQRVRLPTSNKETLERFQYKLLRIIIDTPWYVPNTVM
jgi:hypothetical protein